MRSFEECYRSGLQLEKEGRFKEAIEWYQEAIAIDPWSAGAWFQKMQVHNELGQRAEAEEAARIVLSLKPEWRKKGRIHRLYPEAKPIPEPELYDRFVRMKLLQTADEQLGEGIASKWFELMFLIQRGEMSRWGSLAPKLIQITRENAAHLRLEHLDQIFEAIAFSYIVGVRVPRIVGEGIDRLINLLLELGLAIREYPTLVQEKSIYSKAIRDLYVRAIKRVLPGEEEILTIDLCRISLRMFGIPRLRIPGHLILTNEHLILTRHVIQVLPLKKLGESEVVSNQKEMSLHLDFGTIKPLEAGINGLTPSERMRMNLAIELPFIGKESQFQVEERTRQLQSLILKAKEKLSSKQ